ncbi:MAG: hypothetical protein LBR64_02980 [Dysgonamonadaceae bacterium]|jgi:hypothetical protein|nr:hypothetical protein [Dysgonamonadaceae bacterium]
MRKNKFYLLLLLAFTFCKVEFAHAQCALNIVDLYNEPYRERQKTIAEEAGRGNYSFDSRTSGIVFQAVATPSKTLKNEKIGLDLIDGQFVVSVGNKKIYPDLPLWQLVPIANFANSPYQVVFTAFGDTINGREAQCRFHRAFLNTLLGLRLFQADMINYPDIIWDLPIDLNRNYFKAKSESSYSPRPNEAIDKKIATLLTDGDNKFSSYVLTDRNVEISFDLAGNDLKFSGRPFYLFVRREANSKNIDKIRSELDACFNEIDASARALLKDKYTADLNPRTNLKGLLKTVDDNKDLEKFNAYASHDFRKAVGKLEAMNSLTDEAMGMRLVLLNDFSDAFDQNWDLLKQYNPLVYTAVENASQWSALFRYVYKTNPTNWADFQQKIRAIKTIPDAPEVKTPTSFEINYFRMFGDELKQ